jgi:hypothetical protein
VVATTSTSRCDDGEVSRWRLLDHWERDLAGLSLDQLQERLALAKAYESRSMRKGLGRNPKAGRAWRQRLASVEAEMKRRAERGA